MAFGDYIQLQRENGKLIGNLDILVGTQNYDNVLSPKSANHRIYVQKITLSITTHFDGTVTFDDDGAGPPIAAYTDEATATATGQGHVPVVWDFGPNGRPLTLGANLDVNQSAAGIVGIVHIEAYQKLDTTINVNSGSAVS